MNKIINKKRENNTTFEDIRHIDLNGIEYWTARELSKILEYTEWRNFIKVINKAKEACENSSNDIDNHFVEFNKMVELGSSAKRKIEDYKLTRYACYLIVQNADSKKEVVAIGQTYFAIQTRKQELSEIEYDNLPETKKRFYQRNITKQGNYLLQQLAKN